MRYAAVSPKEGSFGTGLESGLDFGALDIPGTSVLASPLPLAPAFISTPITSSTSYAHRWPSVATTTSFRPLASHAQKSMRCPSTRGMLRGTSAST
eukprot:scaffold14318_cov28-Tisochrysis_lutea.AAC.2